MKITFTDKKTGKLIGEGIFSDAEAKALNWYVERAEYKNPNTGKITKGIAGWILNCVGQKTRQCMDLIIEEYTNKQPAKLSVEDREAVVNLAALKSAREINEEFRYEWSMIPHFHNYPFYVYAYAFGQLLVLALYKQYREEGDSFKPRYLEILSAGGSDSPIRTLERAGIDVTSPDFWNGGFQVVEEALQKLEAMPVEA